MKKIFLLITILAIGVLSCGNNDNKNISAAPENNTQNVEQIIQQHASNEINIKLNNIFS